MPLVEIVVTTDDAMVYVDGTSRQYVSQPDCWEFVDLARVLGCEAKLYYLPSQEYEALGYTFPPSLEEIRPLVEEQ